MRSAKTHLLGRLAALGLMSRSSGHFAGKFFLLHFVSRTRIQPARGVPSSPYRFCSPLMMAHGAEHFPPTTLPHPALPGLSLQQEGLEWAQSHCRMCVLLHK